MSPNIPILCTVNSLLVPSLLVRHRPTHTPWSAKDAMHSPVSVHTIPASQSGPTPSFTDVKCNCAGSPHTPHGQPKDAMHSPVSVRTILWLPNPGQHHHQC